ncbi:MAG: prepilin-type N-terminal cleavage/methylation domain-containing protein [Kiritimatiellae bacterium]|nr:prepilin-type N-terminal cleavage/methylation domain-containing protein [Kiritimatiellia bacterium]
MRTKQGFTLIELMVVVALIALVFAIAVPSFENAGRRDVYKPAQQVASALRLARQSAVVRRQWTMFVIPTADSSYSEKDVKKALRSYAVLACTNMGGVKPTTPFDKMEKTFLTTWRPLPDGVYFADSYRAFQNPVNGSMSPAKPDEKGTKMACLLYKPNGECYVWSGLKWENQQDSNGCLFLQLRSDRYYETEGSGDNWRLGDGIKLDSGTNTVVSVTRQRGTVKIGG